MENNDLKAFIKELQRANVTIAHSEDETILSYNGMTDPSQLNDKLIEMNFNMEHFITKYMDSPGLLDFLDHYAASYKKHINELFPSINNHITTRSLYIEDNIKGHVQFKDLDTSLQEKISRFASIQKDYFILFIDILRTSDKEQIESNYPYIYNSTSTNLVTALMAIYASNHFISPGDESLNKLSTYINITCDQLNIPRVNNLNSVISNIKKKASPTQPILELSENLLKITD